MRLTKGARVILTLSGIGLVVFGGNYYVRNHGAVKTQSTVPTKSGDLVEFKDTAGSTTLKASDIKLPGTAAATINAPLVKVIELPWNSQMGFNLAVGGPRTTVDSLMAKYGVNISVEMSDDYGVMQAALVACATELSQGKKQCSKGANFVTIMGDGGPAFLAGVNETLSKLGKQYQAEVVASFGRSDGEDKFMAPQAVLDNAANAAGLVISGVPRDGDMNIALYWAQANGVCNNPDPKTYDPNCLNWVATTTFTEADDKYIQGYCEDRPVVSKGKKTGKTQNVCVKAVVTWTPGDVTVATKKGGVVTILSTKENSSQMPQAFIGIKAWNEANRDTVKGILRAAYEGGDQVKVGGKTVLLRAGDASAKIYKSETAAYWAKYYKGAEVEDATGVTIHLGGSRAFNLADAQRLFGLEEGAANAYAATYTVFGEMVKAQYPIDLPSYPAVEDILNLSFIKEIAAEGTVAGKADAPKFEENPAATTQIGKANWKINFQTGSAAFAGADGVLKSLRDQLVVAESVYVEVHGYTDNVGDPANNQVLSQARADAVKAWLERSDPKNFPQGRVKAIGHGQSDPVATNDTANGRAANRRVTLILKSNQ